MRYSSSLDCPQLLPAVAAKQIKSRTITGTIERLVQVDDVGFRLVAPELGPRPSTVPGKSRLIQHRHVSLPQAPHGTRVGSLAPANLHATARMRVSFITLPGTGLATTVVRMPA